MAKRITKPSLLGLPSVNNMYQAEFNLIVFYVFVFAEILL